MKGMRKAICVAVICLLCGGGISLVRSVNHMKWVDYTTSEIHQIALSIESFKDLNGKYPTNLFELKADKNAPVGGAVLQLLNGVSGNHYEYHGLSNGFVLAATKSPSLFSPSERMTNWFQGDDPFSNEVKVLKNK
jgi:hypothetical protein